MRRRQIWEMRNAETNKLNSSPKPKDINPHECPNCGRVFKKGLHLHLRHCHVVSELQ